jgi:hypothetical protein
MCLLLPYYTASSSAHLPSAPRGRARQDPEGAPCHRHPLRFLSFRSGRFQTRVSENSLLSGHISPLGLLLPTGCLCPPPAFPAPLDPFGAVAAMLPPRPCSAARMVLRSYGLYRDRRQRKLAAGFLHLYLPTRVFRAPRSLSILTTPRGWQLHTSLMACPCQSHRTRRFEVQAPRRFHRDTGDRLVRVRGLGAAAHAQRLLPVSARQQSLRRSVQILASP